MKLDQIQEDKSPEQFVRVKRRYEYLATNRLKEYNPIVRVIGEVLTRRLQLSVGFKNAPWLNSFKSHFVNKALPKELAPRAQQAVEHFAEQFAEKHGIPYTEISCHWNLIAIRYEYE